MEADAPRLLRVAVAGGGSFGSVMARVVASAAAAAPEIFEPSVAELKDTIPYFTPNFSTKILMIEL